MKRMWIGMFGMIGWMTAAGGAEPAPAAPEAWAVPPYLQNVTATEATVLWQTSAPAYGWVEYGETPALGLRRDRVVDGLRAANTRLHRVRLDGLAPGREYWYRVGFAPVAAMGAYHVDFGTAQQSSPRSFRTAGPANSSVTGVIFNDLHDQLDLFRKLSAQLANVPFQFSLFNGDCFADPADATRPRQSLRAYNAGIGADRRPAVYLRGNHETRGAFARELPAFFAWPEGRPYFAFTAGPVRFVALDCGEDKPDDHPAYSGLADFTAYRREEAAWLKREVASAAFRDARWRVLVHHIPLYAGPEDDVSRPCRDLWAPILAGAGIDLSIHGHTHRRAWYPRGAADNPYPVLLGGGPGADTATVMVLDADARRLSVRILDAAGREVLPAFQATSPRE